MAADQQHPIDSPFDRRSTAAQVMCGVSLAGTTAVVTGGASGIGLATVRGLAAAGAHVIVGARRPDEAARELRGLESLVRVLPLDLMDAISVDAFAQQTLKLLEREGERLGLLVESAGIMYAPQRYDAAGNESHLSTNFLGHYRLAVRLWPALVAAASEAPTATDVDPANTLTAASARPDQPASRIVVLTSSGHRHAGVDYDDPNFERRPYDPRLAYAQSKTADIQLALALDSRGREHGVRAFAVHPGMVPGTNLGRFMGAGPQARRVSGFLLNRLRLVHVLGGAMHLMARLGNGRMRHPGTRPDAPGAEPPYFKTVQQGAASVLWAATSPLLASGPQGIGGVYVEDCNVASVALEDSASPYGVRPWAVDPASVERTWALAERLTGLVL